MALGIPHGSVDEMTELRLGEEVTLVTVGGAVAEDAADTGTPALNRAVPLRALKLPSWKFGVKGDPKVTLTGADAELDAEWMAEGGERTGGLLGLVLQIVGLELRNLVSALPLDIPMAGDVLRAVGIERELTHGAEVPTGTNCDPRGLRDILPGDSDTIRLNIEDCVTGSSETAGTPRVE